jgi:hypothetical protein
MTDLIVLVPTRGRIVNAARLVTAFATTCRANTLLVLGVDEDDPDLNGYRATGGVVEVLTPAGPGMVGGLNQMVERFGSQATALGFMGDDHCPRTEGWDRHLCDAIEAQGGGVAFGNDLVHGPNLATAAIMDARIPQTLGYMAPPTLRHLYVDNVWLDWGRGLGKLAYRNDVVIEHLHPIVGKADNDDRYEAVNNGTMFTQDKMAYDAYVQNQLSVDIIRMAEAMA